MTRAALSIGSNLGDREANIAAMELELSLILADTRASALMETDPVSVESGQPLYLNKIVTGLYSGTPHQLLEACLVIEARLGRTRDRPKGARTADVDILLFGGHVVCDDCLVIPHPQVLNRRFCLEGLALVAPRLTVPGIGNGRTAAELYENMGAEVAAQNVFWV